VLQPVSRQAWRQLGLCEIRVLLDLRKLRREIGLLIEHIFPSVFRLPNGEPAYPMPVRTRSHALSDIEARPVVRSAACKY
jgi:hypothetical protein